VSYHLPPLDAEETCNYINHRLRRAALATPLEFPREATDLIHARSRGVPRIINVICDAALVFGYAEERRTFDAATIAEVLAELETTGVLPRTAGAAVPAAPPPAPVAAETLRKADTAATARAIALDERERQLRQRERELAEQRRVLAEEYRLLRSRAAASRQAEAPVMPAVRFEMSAREGLWQRVKRIMLGVSPS